MITKFFDSIIYAAKKLIKIWDVDVDNIVISKLIETKNNFKYLIGYLDEVIRPLGLVLPKTNGYIKTFKIRIINYLYMLTMINNQKSIKPIGLRFKASKILN